MNTIKRLKKNPLKKILIAGTAGAAGYTIAVSDKNDVYNGIGADMVGMTADFGLDLALNKAIPKVGTSIAKIGTSIGVKVGTKIATVAATSTAAGPLFILAFIVQVALAILDAFWNPWAHKTNGELSDMKRDMDNSMEKAMLSANKTWPLEVLPSFVSDEETIRKRVQQYFDDNNLLTSEEVLAEEDLFISMDLNNRASRYFLVDENGYSVLKDPIITVNKINEDAFDQEVQNITRVIVASRAPNEKSTDKLIKYERPWYFMIQKYIEAEWISICFSIIVLILSSVSCSLMFRKRLPPITTK